MSRLFDPFQIGELRLANRIIIAPMCQYSADEGSATDWHFIHLGHLALSGAAMRRSYRDRIRAGAPGVRFVFLVGPAELIRARMAGRSGHYMPESLLASQLQTLERPGADEPDVQRLDIEQPAEALIDAAARALGR